MFFDTARVDAGRLQTACGGGVTTIVSTNLSRDSKRALVTSAADTSAVVDLYRSAKPVIGVTDGSGLLNFSANIDVSLTRADQRSAVDQGSVGRSVGVTRARAGGGDKGLT